ncbi:hypothetical protein GCM10009836_25730 [Pseudonocardia ailaonensis]|uniref:SsuA/THI5-like domain-containing protein n=1 Tax=Pseudonocardia ailaonensis TaxID=367279 RepID=A0ABN2MZM8_9PSEU
MFRSGRWRWGITMGAVALMALTACGSGGSASGPVEADGGGPASVGQGPGTPNPSPLKERTTVTVLYSTAATSFMSVLIAKEMGEFEKENLDVELRTVPTTDGAVLVARGEADVQMAGFNASALNLLAQSSAPIKYVTSASVEEPPTAGLYVNNQYVKDGHVDPAAIRGQSLMFGPGGGGLGNPGALQWYTHATKNGIPLDAVTPAVLSSSTDGAIAMLNNRIAGGGLFTSAARLLDAQKDRFTMVEHNAAAAVYVANSEWLKDQPQVAAAFFRAVMRTNRTYLQGDYLENKNVLDIEAKLLGSTPENVVADGLARYSPDLDSSVPKGLFPSYQDLSRAAGVLSYGAPLPTDKAFDDTPVRDVLQGKY